MNSDAERARCKELAQAGIGIEQGPLQDADYARRIARDAQVVIHLAAAQHEANVPDDYFFDVNVNGTRTLLDASKRAGVERFVYGSTIGVYGESGGETLDENTPPRPMNVYGRSKLAAEEVVKSHGSAIADEHRAHLRDLRSGRFSPAQIVPRARPRTLHHRGLGAESAPGHPRARLGAGTAARRDASRGGRRDLRHGGAGDDDDARDGGARGALRSGARAPRWHVPMWPFLAAAVVMEKTLSPLGIQPPLHRRRLDFFRKSFVFSTAKAQRLLGFTAAVPFAAGTVETANWYREQGYLPR